MMRGRKRAAKRLGDETPRESMYGSAAAWISGRPAWAQRAAKGGIAAMAAAAIMASAAFGVSRAVRPAEAPPPDPEATLEAGGEASGAALEEEGGSRFINLEAYGFLGAEARGAFVREFSEHLASQGVPEGEFVMCYSRVDSDGDACTAWASCPNGERFWKISYDLASKGFAFEACEGVPDGLPEINYEALEEAEKREPETVPEEALGDIGGPPSEPRSQEPVAEPGGVALDDVAGLSEVLPKEAAETVAEAMVEGALREYGFVVEAASSTVERGTVERAGGWWSFTVFCRNPQGGSLALRVDYDEATGAFSGQRI